MSTFELSNSYHNTEENRSDLEAKKTEYITARRAELLAPTVEKPLAERQTFSDAILDELEQREAKRQEERWAVKPFGAYTPEGMATKLGEFNQWVNGSSLGKVVGSTAKIVLGGAAIASTVATGGTLGMLFAPLLFSGGVKSIASGGIELFQEFFGSRVVGEDGKVEMNSGRNNRLRLESAKQIFVASVRQESGDIATKLQRGELDMQGATNAITNLLENIKSSEQAIIASENQNIDVEKARAKFRGLASTGISLATGMLAGIPIGQQNFDSDSIKHLVTFGAQGWSFNYNPGELLSQLGGPNLTPYDLFGRGLAHTLGGIPPNEALAGMVGAGLAISAKTVQELLPARHVSLPTIQSPVKVSLSQEQLPDSQVTYAKDNKKTEAISERLLENPNAKLDHFQELGEYFAKQKPENLVRTHMVAEQISEPMTPECRLVVCIPVAGHQEGQNIYASLDNYKNQRSQSDDSILDPKKYEIILYVNHPEGKEPDETLTEIQRFKDDNPLIPVKIIYETLDKADANMYRIRKIISDATVLRHHRRGQSAPDLLLVSNDADNKGMSPYYLDNYISKFDRADEEGIIRDGIAGRLDWDPEVMRTNPMVYLTTRLSQYMEIQNRHPRSGSPYYNTSGANFAFKSSIYAAVGGYSDSGGVSTGEDETFGNKVKHARASSVKPVGFGMKKSLLYTSARRSLEAASKGYAPYQQWQALEFGPNDALRTKKSEDYDHGISADEALADPVKKKEFCSALSLLINKQLLAWGIIFPNPKISRSLDFLGIPYEIDKGLVIVTPEKIDTLLHDLSDYHDYVALERYKRNTSSRPER